MGQERRNLINDCFYLTIMGGMRLNQVLRHGHQNTDVLKVYGGGQLEGGGDPALAVYAKLR